MKNLIKFSALLIVVLFALNNTANAQLKLTKVGDQEKLLFGNTTPYRYFQITFVTNGLYMTDANRFLQLDNCVVNPRIAGAGDQVVFYNSATSTFNSIQVKNVYNYSDLKAKTNIKSLNTRLSSLSILSRLRPVSYSFVDNSQEASYKRGASTTEVSSNMEIGLLAQEVEAVLPNVVLTDPEGKKLINYTALIPVLIEAIKELKKEVDELKKEKGVTKTLASKEATNQ